MRTLVISILGLIVCGCVVQPETPEAIAAAPLEDPAEQPKIVCKREKPTGSNRPVEVCRQVAGALEQAQTKRDMRVLKRQSEIVNR